MYTVLCVDPGLRFTTLTDWLYPYCRVTYVTRMRDALEVCTVERPDILIGSIEAQKDDLLELAVKLQSLDWPMPLIACLNNQQSSSISALQRLGATLCETPDKLLPLIAQLLSLPLKTSKTHP